MPHHFQKNIDEAPAYCNKCQRETRHRVFDGRLAHCLEHQAQPLTKAQIKRREEAEKEKQNPRLF
jgi:hypothetical protein